MKPTKQFFTFALLIFMVLLGCNKDDTTIIPPDPKQQVPEKPVSPEQPEEIDDDLTLETMTRSLNLQAEALSKYNEYLQETAEVERAIFYTGLWLQQDHNVEEVAFTSDYLIHVTFKNGLRSNLVFMLEDENGKAIYRGAPNISDIAEGSTDHKMPIKVFESKNRAAKSEIKEIKNKKVLVFNVEEEEFYDNDYSAPLAILNNDAITDLELTVLSNDAATLEKLDEFYKYGLIIINTHGQPGSFSVRSGIKKRGLKDPFTQEDINKNILKVANKNPEDFKNGTLTIDVKTRIKDKHTPKAVEILEIKIGVTDKYIRNLKPLDDAVVFANFCFSGHEVEGPNTRNLVEAFKAIGAKTYYGWATDYGEGEKVIEEGAQKAELQLLRNLVKDGKLTGNSHLLPGGEPIVMSLENYEDFAPGVSVYTVLPNPDGTIDFKDSYQKLWVNNQIPSHRFFTAYALQHHIDPDYYYEPDVDEIVFYVPVSVSYREWVVEGGTKWMHIVEGFFFNPIEAPPNKEIVRYWAVGMEFFRNGVKSFSGTSKTFYPGNEDKDLDENGNYAIIINGITTIYEYQIEGFRATPREGYARVIVTLKRKE